MNELRKRRLIPSRDLDAQESALCDLLGISSPDETPRFAIAARRSRHDEDLSPTQMAWLGCVRKIARTQAVVRLDTERLSDLAANLTRAITTPDAIATLPRRLAETGVRLVHVAALTSGKIDGAAFVDDHGPVIGISGRGARFDGVLFTVLHEIAHVVLGHVDAGYAVDVDLVGGNATSRQEQDADRIAAGWAIPGKLRLTGRISKAKVCQEAQRLKVHPAIIVGRLHHANKLPWSHLNTLIPSAKDQLDTWSR